MGTKGDLLVKRGFRKNYRQEPMEAMKVVVHNNDITKALRTLKKKLQNEGVFNELRERTSFKTRGERRRLEIARCLASNPNFILLDEPLAGIDPIAVNDIKELILNLITSKLKMKKKIDAKETQEALLNIETNGLDIDEELNNKILNLDRQFLHAKQLGFNHPTTNERLEFSSIKPVLEL